MRIVLLIQIICFTAFTSEAKNETHVYSLLNKIIIDYKINHLYNHADNVSYHDGKKTLIFDPKDVDSWFWKNNINLDLKDKIRVIDKEYLLQQVLRKSSIKWDKKLINSNIVLQNNGSFKSKIGNSAKGKIYPIYSISIPVMDKNNEFAFVRFTRNEAPGEEYIVILLYQRFNDRWEYIGERPISMT